MAALVPYEFLPDVRSSRGIKCHCRQDVAYRVITGNLVPDHATIARFIDRHQQALAGLFTEVLTLCEKAGVVESGVVSIDGTRIAGNASPEVNLAFEQIAKEILANTVATDEPEDEKLGQGTAGAARRVWETVNAPMAGSRARLAERIGLLPGITAVGSAAAFDAEGQ